jgi:hypothetical protein
MSAEVKPGTVAMVTWKALGQWKTEIRFRALRDGVGEVWNGADGSWIGDATAKEVTPLVVIDPSGNPEGLPYLVPQHFRNYATTLRQHHGPVSALMLEWIADQLEAFKPRPLEEPSDPKARVTDRRDNIWRLLADGDWVCTSGPDIGEYLAWDRLATERGARVVEA